MNAAHQAEIRFGKHEDTCKFCGAKFSNTDGKKWYICPESKYLYCQDCAKSGKEMDFCRVCTHFRVNHGAQENENQ